MAHKAKAKFLAMVADIPEDTSSPSRASARMAGQIDEHTMTRAEWRTVMKNLEFSEGNKNASCLFLKPVQDAIQNIKQLGVSFGKSNTDQEEAVSLLYKIDRSRSCLPVELGLEGEDISTIDSESQDDFLPPSSLSHLCGSITDEVFDGEDCQLNCDFKAVYKKNKRNRCCNVFSKQNKSKVRIVKICRTGLK